jgi:hypothetical protein
MKVLFDMAQNQISLEGDGPDLMTVLQLVRDIAPKVSEIRIVTSAISGRITMPDSNQQERPAGQRGIPSMKEFARAIDPRTITEKIVSIAEYVKRHDGRSSFSAREMSDWFTICGFEKPSQMPVALFDGKRKYGYLDKAGHGQWRLSTAGENFVTRKLETKGGDPA